MCATLRPGTQAGRSDLLLQAQPGALLSGGVELDNYGGKYTGEYRLGGSLNLNSPLTLGDQLSLRAMGSDGRQQYQRISYQLPLGPWLTRLGAAYSNMEYRLGRSLSDLGMHGNARITSGFVSQALRRGRNFSLHGQLLYEDKQLKDDIEFDGAAASSARGCGPPPSAPTARTAWAAAGSASCRWPTAPANCGWKTHWRNGGTT